MQSGKIFAITPLNGNNYNTWSAKCTMLLKCEGLWNIVAEPPDLTDLDPAVERDAKRINDFNRDNDKAHSIIGLTLEDAQLTHIRGVSSAAECWDILRRLYVRDSVGAHIQLTRKLFRTRLVQNGDMLAHLTIMKDLLSELREKELIFSELHQVYIILSSLDESYDDFVSSLGVLSREEMTVTDISSRLLEEARTRRERHLLREEKNEQFAAKTPRRESFVPKNNLSAKKCYVCNKPGHIAKYCCQKDKTSVTNLVARNAVKQTNYVKECLWVVDSGATYNIVRDKKCFVKVNNSTESICLANGWKLKAYGEGMVNCDIFKETMFALYVPQAKYNLLSVNALAKLGYTVMFKNNNCIIEGKGFRLVAENNDGLYIINEKEKTSNAMCSNTKPHNDCIHLMHRRMGHLNFQLVKKTIGMVNGIKVKPCSKYVNCNVCNEEKSKVIPANRYDGFKTKDILELVCIDLIGPMKYPSYGGSRYVLSIVDHYSRFGFVYTMKNKAETFRLFRNWLRFVERKTAKKLITVITDNGTEFTNQRFVELLKESGIEHRLSAPYRPQHNAFVERRGQTLQAMMRSMIRDSGLSDRFWAEAIASANVILNNIVHRATGEIPFTRWYNRKPDLSYLRVFGAPAWVHIPAQLRQKGGHRARLLYFVGYDHNHKSYRFFDKNKCKVYLSSNAKFLEHTGWDKIEACDETTKKVVVEVPLFKKEHGDYRQQSIADSDSEESLSEEEIPDGAGSVPIIGVKDEVKQESESVPSDSVPRENILRRTTRVTRKPDRYQANIIAGGKVCVEPSHYGEIKLLPVEERKCWQDAMQKELAAMKDLNVYEEMQLPQGEHLVGSRWVFKVKTGADGTTKNKARLVAQGFSQMHGDYDEVFAPSLRAATLRTALVWAARHKYCVHHVDVETAYLHAPLQHKIYMRIPQGVNHRSGMCWKLNKSLYGLKQSGYEWNTMIVSELEKEGFVASKADPCMFVRNRKHGMDVLLLFTDDIAIISKTPDSINKIIERLEKKFKIRKLGEIKQYIGVDIKRTKGGFKLSQAGKINNLLKKFSMQDCKIARTPMELGFVQCKNETGKQVDKEMYRSLIGSLSYLANWTRPDIAFSVNQLARFSKEPTELHWKAAKRILRYLKGSMYHGLFLEPDKSLELVAYADASFASDNITRKSTTGLTILLGGALIGWKSLRQQHLSLSTMEAEFASLSVLCTDLIIYRQLLSDLNIEEKLPIKVYEDNQAAISMAKGRAIKTRSKHTDLRYQNVRKNIKDGIIVLEYCESKDNVADQFTKAQSAKVLIDGCQKYNLKQ